MLEARAYRSLRPSRFVPCVDAAASPLAQDAAAFSALPPRELYQLFGVEEIAEVVEAARHRLVSPEQMGALFKVIAFAGEGWPDGAGLARATIS